MPTRFASTRPPAACRAGRTGLVAVRLLPLTLGVALVAQPRFGFDWPALADRFVRQLGLQKGVRWNFSSDTTVTVGDTVCVRGGRRVVR